MVRSHFRKDQQRSSWCGDGGEEVGLRRCSWVPAGRWRECRSDEKVRSSLETEDGRATDTELEVEIMEPTELCRGRKPRRKRMWTLEKAPKNEVMQSAESQKTWRCPSCQERGACRVLQAEGAVSRRHKGMHVS